MAANQLTWLERAVSAIRAKFPGENSVPFFGRFKEFTWYSRRILSIMKPHLLPRPETVMPTRNHAALPAFFRTSPLPLTCITLVLSCVTYAEGPETKKRDNNKTSSTATDHPSLDELKKQGALRSAYRQRQQIKIGPAPQPGLSAFKKHIAPILKKNCVDCHGPDAQEGNIRIDTLDPDLFHGDDVNWWLEVQAVLSNGEMPPPADSELTDKDRSSVVEWLSHEIQVASTVRRAEQGHSSFRRLARYEYNYVLQDLLGRPLNFARDLPPDPISEDGFTNSSEMLHMSPVQFQTYRALARRALELTTVSGKQPRPIYWRVPLHVAAEKELKKQDAERDALKQKHANDDEKQQRELAKFDKRQRTSPNHTHFKDRVSGRVARTNWRYSGAKYAWNSLDAPPDTPPVSNVVAVIPPYHKLIVELGDRIPKQGILRVRARAARESVTSERIPELQLEFGWQASNDSQATVRISQQDTPITADPDEPQFYEWRVPLSDVYPRNLVRGISKMGDLPSPSEYLKFVNSSVSKSNIQIDYIEVVAPFCEQWPPKSHVAIFGDESDSQDEFARARNILQRFMPRAYRRAVSHGELDRKLKLFQQIRPDCVTFRDAIIEVLATVLASPNFLYLSRATSEENSRDTADSQISHDELATRLAVFLWCSMPDDELRQLATQQQLRNPDVLNTQVKRMLADPRAKRFSEQFVRQWLGLQLLDYLKIDRKIHRHFRPELKQAMQEEPVVFFHNMLETNNSVLDFIHADYAFLNERLAAHYQIRNVHGNHFRRVAIEPENQRGGLLTQAGLLAMNSDGKDSHPLKRGIWLLRSLLNDPPPPPPPAVPEIDLADPEIAKLTLKQRIEDHRNHAACMSCHAKIDPWGIAFENFDATGRWRTQIQNRPVDASSKLFNQQTLNGINGLKRYLLTNRQDQFTRALVHKMLMFALGRPLKFSDRSSVDQITADLRQQGDGLATLVQLIVQSSAFHTR